MEAVVVGDTIWWNDSQNTRPVYEDVVQAVGLVEEFTDYFDNEHICSPEQSYLYAHACSYPHTPTHLITAPLPLSSN